MHQVSMVITGTAVMMLPLIKSFEGIIVYVIMVGLVDGCFVVLLPVLTTAFIGIEDTVLAWGFLVGTASITFTMGPPIAGNVYMDLAYRKKYKSIPYIKQIFYMVLCS